ncbi:methyltransferase domain-containing protein [Candidatus Woesearchaeota archaeon]|nr:methyltransferase domain-containing protein [Candidatus Woesearchaeota archaeon]
MDNKEWKGIVGKLGEEYDRVVPAYVEATAARAHIERLEEFLGYLPPADLGKIADIGCGPGRDATYFHEQGYEVIGVDCSGEMIAFAQEQSPSIDFHVADAVTFEFPELVDVWASSSLQHIGREQIRDLLRNLSRNLVAGGGFHANFREGHTEGPEESEEYGKPITRFVARYGEEEFNGLLRETGFEVVRSETYAPNYSGRKGKDVPIKVQVYARKG